MTDTIEKTIDKKGKAKAKIRELMAMNSVDDLLDIIDIISTRIFTRHKGGDGSVSTHFVRRVKVVFTTDVTEVEPDLDPTSIYLTIYSPLVVGNIDQEELTKTALRKEYLPTIKAINARYTQELFEWYLLSATDKGLKDFVDELEKKRQQRKDQAQENESAVENKKP